ncbi:tail fiber protein [Pectobacterium phage Jarilo]|uniref:Tail fiber protein n=1 Tax=Pectobacterium phage Jarilo TaxID=2163634 RepID=A0A2S1GT38_9CAUD|nr:tail fiber protein [Pectobacterium phage Jarilo]AWD92522.1 tail fiber protein [Pectobacterium phage Jarilo]
MANVIKTILTYPLTGQSEFLIPFEYLARKFVVVTLIGVDRKELVLGTDYRFATKTTIVTNNVWGQGDGYTTLEIRRFTSATERLVDFTDGSILRAYDLNVAQLQTIHVAEEARDLTADTIGTNAQGQLDARGRRIVNLANAIDAADAVPLGQIQGINQNAWQARDEALGFRNEAEGFRNMSVDRANVATQQANIAIDRANVATQQAADALTSASRALASQQAASWSQTAAAASASASASSASSASTSSDTAMRWATLAENVPVTGSQYSAMHWAIKAKLEADKLGNWNALAGTIENINGNDIIWRGWHNVQGLYVWNPAGNVLIETATPGQTPDIKFTGYRGDKSFMTFRLGADVGDSNAAVSHGMYSTNIGQHYQFNVDGSNHISSAGAGAQLYMGSQSNPSMTLATLNGMGLVNVEGSMVVSSGLVASHDVEARGAVYSGGLNGGKLTNTGNIEGSEWGSRTLKGYIDDSRKASIQSSPLRVLWRRDIGTFNTAFDANGYPLPADASRPLTVRPWSTGQSYTFDEPLWGKQLFSIHNDAFINGSQNQSNYCRAWGAIPRMSGVTAVADNGVVFTFTNFEMQIGSEWWHLVLSADGRTLALDSAGEMARPLYALYVADIP